MNQLTQNSSYSFQLLNYEKNYHYSEKDNAFQSIKKFSVGSFLSLTALTTAVAETFFSFLLFIFSSPAYFIASSQYSKITQHTKDALKIVPLALKRLFGFGAIVSKTIPPLSLSPPKPVRARIEECKQFFSKKGIEAISFGKKHKKMLLFGTALIMTLACAYHLGKIFLHTPEVQDMPHTSFPRFKTPRSFVPTRNSKPLELGNRTTPLQPNPLEPSPYIDNSRIPNEDIEAFLERSHLKSLQNKGEAISPPSPTPVIEKMGQDKIKNKKPASLEDLTVGVILGVIAMYLFKRNIPQQNHYNDLFSGQNNYGYDY